MPPTKWFDTVKTGDVKKMKLLLKKGADVNTPDKYGETALINASRAGRIETVKLKRYVERIKPGLDWDTVEARELALKKIQEIINRYKSEGVSAGGMGRTCFLFNE